MNGVPSAEPGVDSKSTAGRRLPLLAIVGSPNVGKSVLFNSLTGAYVTVSNYPGTTVEVYRGKATLGGREVEVVDTPGIYALLPISEEEAVTRRLLLEEHPREVLHVTDARNLQRMLPLTLQLLEAGLPVTLALNMMDEADALGFTFDLKSLSKKLGIHVRATAGAIQRGVRELAELLASRIAACSSSSALSFRYDPIIEQAIGEIEALAGGVTAITPRATALLLLQRDRELLERLRNDRSAEVERRVLDIIAGVEARFSQPLPVVIALRRQQVVEEILDGVMDLPSETPAPPLDTVSRILTHPVWGLPVLLAVLYFGIYQFVGVLGAGVLVNFLQDRVFGGWINPWATRWIEAGLPPLWSNLFVGEYGILTLGITYAVAIVLPIVSLFFFVFALMEDVGYLPRLAYLMDRICKWIGLNGRAVIPLVLGFGCDTMATMVTRVLETRRERIIATLLLALAIPCSAQSGLFMGMLGAVQPCGLLIYAGILVAIFFVVGLLAARLLPGQKAHFYLEIPPLRLPRLGNVLMKTYTRLEWYLLEVIPMFIAASVLLWIGSLVWNGHAVVFSPHHGLFGLLERALDPLGALIGLPTAADVARDPALEFTGGTILLAGFFRRDFGAAGLWHLFKHGLITPTQILVAAVALTLFLPCIAQFLMMKKEHGWRTAVTMAFFVTVVAFGTGFLLRVALESSNIHLFLNGELR
jgi:ferrous iron transport protein B